MGLYMAQTGNWSAASWKLCDAVLRSEANAGNVSTTETFTSAFSLAGGDYDAIILWQAMRSNTNGTLRVRLYKAGVFVAGTEVTINTYDLQPIGTTANREGGPICFKWAAPVTLAAAADYTIGTVASAGNNIGFWNNGTANNWCRAVRFSGLSSVAAGDEFIICEEKTGAGAKTAITMTYDVTATTQWGSGSNSQATRSLDIGDGGTFKSATAAATNYYFRLAGTALVAFGGTVEIGSDATPIPSNSSFIWEWWCTANVDFGIEWASQCTISMVHTDRFATDANGDENTWVRLVADLASGAGTGAGAVQTQDITGWAVNDEIEISQSRTSGSANDLRTISAIASSTSFSINSNASAIHHGSSTPQTMRSHVCNLTRGIIMRGRSSTLQGFVASRSNFNTTPLPAHNITLKGVTFQWMGSATTGKRGVEIIAMGGNVTIQRCVFREFNGVTSGTTLFSFRGTDAVWDVRDNIFYLMQTSVNFGSLSQGNPSGYLPTVTPIFRHNLVHRNSNSQGLIWASAAMDCQRNLVFSTSGHNAEINPPADILGSHIVGTFKDNEFACGGNAGGLHVSNPVYGVLENIYSWEGNATNPGTGQLVIGTRAESDFRELHILNPKLQNVNGRRAFVLISGKVRVTNIDIDVTSVAFHHSDTVNQSSGGREAIALINGCTLSSAVSQVFSVQSGSTGTFFTIHNMTTSMAVTNANFFVNASNWYSGIVQFTKLNGVDGNDYVWLPTGRIGTGPTIERDTAIFSGSSPSIRVYPGLVGTKVRTPVFRTAVASGQTVTPSIKVRCSDTGAGDSASYNGAVRPRLMMRQNLFANTSVETVIATASAAADGAWETISGVSPTFVYDGIAEFYVDGEGTAGWFNVDEFSCASEDTKLKNFYAENVMSPWVVGGSTGGGGGPAGFPVSRLVT